MGHNNTQLMNCLHGPNNKFENEKIGCQNLVELYWISSWGSRTQLINWFMLWVVDIINVHVNFKVIYIVYFLKYSLPPPNPSWVIYFNLIYLAMSFVHLCIELIFFYTKSKVCCPMVDTCNATHNFGHWIGLDRTNLKITSFKCTLRRFSIRFHNKSWDENKKRTTSNASRYHLSYTPAS